MNYADVVIIGGGCAGSLAAAMLGRAGISTALIDIHETYPEDFRAEKILDDQATILEKTGLADPVLAAATPIPEVWVSRAGLRIGKLRRRGRPYEYGIDYDNLVNTIRRQIPSDVTFVHAKATSLTNTADQQTVRLSNGELWNARLVVLATGLNRPSALVGDKINRIEISKSHSICFGFDLAAKDGFNFPSITYHGEQVGPVGYVTIFPINTRMRVNLFVYHEWRDPWIKQARSLPIAAMLDVMPRLKRYLDGVELASKVQVRPIDLYDTKNYLHPGIVLVGDSITTSCPAAGTGLSKVLTDVELLCNHHLPVWLKTAGMSVAKIEEFYKDPIKTACDEWSKHEAFYIRSVAAAPTLPWRIRRIGWIGYQSALGIRSLLLPRNPMLREGL